MASGKSFSRFFNMLKETKIIILRILTINDPEKVGDTIKYWLLQAAAQGAGLAVMWFEDFLASNNSTWKEIVYRGIFAGGVGNAFLHFKTPRTKAQIGRSRQQVSVTETVETTNENETGN